jgi:hypothetical protein
MTKRSALVPKNKQSITVVTGNIFSFDVDIVADPKLFKNFEVGGEMIDDKFDDRI